MRQKVAETAPFVVVKPIRNRQKAHNEFLVIIRIP